MQSLCGRADPAVSVSLFRISAWNPECREIRLVAADFVAHFPFIPGWGESRLNSTRELAMRASRSGSLTV
jgi:hypothetical protein